MIRQTASALSAQLWKLPAIPISLLAVSKGRHGSYAGSNELRDTDAERGSIADPSINWQSGGQQSCPNEAISFTRGSDESSGNGREKEAKVREKEEETRIFLRAFTSRPKPALTPEARFNIRLWRLCFTVWDTHSAPFRPINPHSAFNLRVFASYSSPTLANPSSKGVGHHGDAEYSDAQSWGACDVGVSPTKPWKTIIIDGERGTEGNDRGTSERAGWKGERGWWFSFFLPFRWDGVSWIGALEISVIKRTALQVGFHLVR